MKKIRITVAAMAFLFGMTLLSSCSSREEKTETSTTSETEVVAAKDGAEFYKKSGCTVCHQVDTKLVGPAIVDIAAAYPDAAALTKFLKGESASIVTPEQYPVMAPQVEITKKMTDEDLQVIVNYILSHKK